MRGAVSSPALTMTVANGRPARRALWFAVLAMLALLVQPLIADRAHAAMRPIASTTQTPMQMPGMAVAVAVSSPCHHDGRAPCAVACALAAELLPPAAGAVAAPFGGSTEQRVAWLAVQPSQTRPESDTPPPR